MSEASVPSTKRVVICDKCGEQGEREDIEGRPWFIRCAVCKKDFCWGCYTKNNNTVKTLHELYDWVQTESFICAECYDRMKTNTQLQEGIASFVQGSEKRALAESEMTLARSIIAKVVREAGR